MAAAQKVEQYRVGKVDRRAGELEKTAEAAIKYDAFGPSHSGPFRPFDCGRTVQVS